MVHRKYEYSESAGWSFSRYDSFRTCKRQYFFDYYGKKFAPPDLKARIELLKNLQSAPLIVGQIVHDSIAAIIKNFKGGGNDISLQDITDRAKRSLSVALAGPNLLDAYYGSPIGPARKFELEFQLETCLEAFYGLRWYHAMRSAPSALKARWIVEPEDFGEFRLDGLKAYAKVDFAFPTDDGSLRIIDWKTGKRYEEKHFIQMQGYILYAHDIHSFPLEKIEAVLEYLADDGEPVSYSMQQDDLQQFRSRLKSELSALHAYCIDPMNNIPLPMESFSLRTDARLCGWCKYRELCNR